MAYRVQKRSNSNAWRVLWRKYEKNTEGDYVAKQRHVPKSEYPKIGITPSMSIVEVDSILKKLNAESELTRREDGRNKVQLRLAKEELQDCAHLPPAFVRKFENEHLPKRYMSNPDRLKKILKLWNAVRKLIRNVSEPMEKWSRYPEHFYVQFLNKQTSPGHVRNLLSTLNMWVDFLGLEQDKNYRQVPAPDDGWQSKINDAFEDSGNSQASLPITPAMLTGLKNPMPNESQFNWLYCSVWAGLRPNEVNALLDKKRTKIEEQDGTPILAVYQSKLKNMRDRSKRWKRIPLFLPEQLKILEIIESGLIEEPLCKTLANRFGEGHSLYGGRKGFHDLMVTKQEQPELEVVRWLGHKSLDMAMKHYAKQDSVRWAPKKAS